jgi:hypothetical protein
MAEHLDLGLGDAAGITGAIALTQDLLEQMHG